MSRSIIAPVALALLVLSPAAFQSAAAQSNQDTTIVRIGTLGGLYSMLLAVNNNNAAVGWSATTNPDWEHAILWHDGHLIDLGTLPGDVLSRAWGINDRGQIVGVSMSSALLPFRARAVIWQHGQVTELPGSERCIGMAINNRGHVAGRCEDQPWLWRNGERVGLGLLPGYVYGDVAAINDDDVVVGTMSDAASGWTAFRWADGVLTDIGALTGQGRSQATAINARGEIAGHVGFSPNPVIWKGDTVTLLAGAWDVFHGVVAGINNRGEVIGSGFVWWRGTFTPLNPTFFASDINDRGTAVGFYSNNDGGMVGAVMSKLGTRPPVTMPPRVMTTP